MLRLIDEQLGRIFLAVAALCAGAVAYVNQYRPLPEVKRAADQQSVRVELDKKSLTASSNEVFFPADDGFAYMGGKDAFVEEKKKKEYIPAELDLPRAGVMRPPQILPEPGPALEGTGKLKRYGEEFPPVVEPTTTPTKTDVPAVTRPPVTPTPDPKTPPKPGPGLPPPKAGAGAGDNPVPPKADSFATDRPRPSREEKAR